MKSVSFGAFGLIVAATVLAACGGSGGAGKTGLSEPERSYTEACVKMMQGEAYRKLCECEAGIVASKLTPGELKVYLSWPDLPKGAMSSADLSKFAAEHGFTIDEMKSRDVKMQTLLPEVNKTCLERK